MNFVLRFLSSVLVFFSFTLLLLFSLSSEKKTIGDAFEEQYLKKFPQESLIFSGSIHHQELSYFEDIYSSSGSVSISVGNAGIDVSLSKKEKILSSFRNPEKNYIFHGEGYKIIQEGIGEVFIDSHSVKNKVFLMPLNTSLTLQLISKNKEVSSSIYITPHMYVEFNPIRGQFLKHADRLRVETVFNVGYLHDLSQKKDDIYAKKYLGDDFFYRVLGEQIQKQEEADLFISSLKGDEVLTIPGEKWIRQFMNIFVNENKKIIFYKNEILGSLLEVLQKSRNTKSDYKKYLRELSELSEVDAEQMKKIYEYLYSQIMLSHNSSYSEQKDILHSFYKKKIKNIEFIRTEYNIFSKLNHTNDLDFSGLEKYILAFDKHGKNVEDIAMKEEYFVYFLEQYISGEFSSQSPSLKNILTSFSYLNTFAQKVYTKDTDYKKTGIYVYNDIISDLELFLRNFFFEAKRDENNLLLSKKQTQLSVEEIGKLEEEVGRAYVFIKKYTDFLSSQQIQEKNIKKEIIANQEVFSEYFLALKNREEYEKTYNTSIKKALELDTGVKNEDTVFTATAIRKYLEKFKNLDMTLSEIISQEDGGYYSIKNIYISGKLFDFDLYPYNQMLLTNIYIDQNFKNFQYKLDVIEEDWIEDAKRASKDDKYLYDFSRFFLNTFFVSQQSSGEIYVYESQGSSEDKSEIVFKRDKLLGGKGEFASLQSILDIEYNDIRLEKNNNLYDIYINDARYSITENQGSSSIRNYSGKFSARYYISENTTNRYFTDVSIVLSEESSSNIKLYMGGQNIEIAGRIKKGSLEQILQAVVQNAENYEDIYYGIYDTQGIVALQLKYSPITKKMLYEFEKDGKNYTLVAANEIERIMLGNNNILPSPISVDQISTYLK